MIIESCDIVQVCGPYRENSRGKVTRERQRVPQPPTSLRVGIHFPTQVKISSIVLRAAHLPDIGGFATDSDISGRSAEHLAGRTLETLDSSWLDKDLAEDTLESRDSVSYEGGKVKQAFAVLTLCGFLNLAHS